MPPKEKETFASKINFTQSLVTLVLLIAGFGVTYGALTSRLTTAEAAIEKHEKAIVPREENKVYWTNTEKRLDELKQSVDKVLQLLVEANKEKK
jgi:hypothetical protein